ncbi:MAG TPA: archease [Candidatus Pacearchaeota archaeon]|nr:archease [Candidatus Pacearchaeota archaeon]
MKKYIFLPHTADVKFQASGKTIEEAFENSALALKERMCNAKIKAKIEKKIEISGRDFENLLYNFLEEFLYLLDAEDFITSKIKSIKISKFKLKAIVVGDKASNYKFSNDVKAITYNEMFVKNTKNLPANFGATKSKKANDFVGEKNKYTTQVVLDV